MNLDAITDDTPDPGDDLVAMSDERLRAVVRAYGWNSPWYGDEDERTPEGELRARYPYLAGLHRALGVAYQLDLDQTAKVDLDGHSLLPDYYSLATQAVEEVYQGAIQSWLQDERWHRDPAQYPHDALHAAGDRLARARQTDRLAKEHARNVLRAVQGVPDATAAALLKVSRMTVLSWLGKR